MEFSGATARFARGLAILEGGAEMSGKASPDSYLRPLYIMRGRFRPLSHALLEIPEVLVNLLQGEAESRKAFRRFAGNVLRGPLAM